MMSLRNILSRSRAVAAPTETEQALRAALLAPVAPGEDESYRRLMGVIAEDLHLRQPAPQRPTWAWAPMGSVAAVAAVLAVFAYQLGVDHGVQVARLNDSAPLVQPEPSSDPGPLVPRGTYTPKPDTSAVKPADIAKPPANTTPRLAPTSREAILATINIEGLNADQRDLLRAFSTYHRAGEFRLAAQQMERLAETAPDTEVALDAWKAAADLYRTRLNDPATANGLYLRIVDAARTMAGTDAEDPDRAVRLEARRKEAEKNLAPPTVEPHMPSMTPDLPSAR